MQTTETLCWSCANATNSGCTWSRSFRPVNGWFAKRRDVLEDNSTSRHYNESYIVIKCPVFREDPPRRWKKRAKRKRQNGKLTYDVPTCMECPMLKMCSQHKWVCNKRGREDW